MCIGVCLPILLSTCLRYSSSTVSSTSWEAGTVVMVVSMPPVDRSSDRPAYKQVADRLRERLDACEFGDNGRLPSESTLMKECQVSRATARRGLAVLIAEGRAEAVPGRGVFAKGPPSFKRLVLRDPARILRAHTARPDAHGPMKTEAESQGFGYDSYATLDVKDKIVVVLQYFPEDADQQTRAVLARYSGLRYKAMAARQRAH